MLGRGAGRSGAVGKEIAAIFEERRVAHERDGGRLVQ
jgi:hypothetical protein